jgi:hypothetical protein
MKKCTSATNWNVLLFLDYQNDLLLFHSLCQVRPDTRQNLHFPRALRVTLFFNGIEDEKHSSKGPTPLDFEWTEENKQLTIRRPDVVFTTSWTIDITFE